jgi:hypothetical protein
MKKKTKKSSTKSQPKPAKKQPNSRQLAHRTYMRKAAKLAPPKRTVSKSSSNTRPSKVRRQNLASTSASSTRTKSRSRNRGIPRAPSLSSRAKAIKAETNRTAKTVQRNLKAAKVAVKKIRDSFGRFTKAVKKASKKNAAKQQAALTASKKAAQADQKRRSATQQKAAKVATKASRTLRGNRKQDTGKVDKKRSGFAKAGGPTRNRATLAQQELEQIERLLGEDFESLAQAREALRLETRGRPKARAVRPLRGVKKGKSSYTLQELASSKSTNLGKLLAKIEENSEQIDQLKQPEQMWAFQIYDRHSLVPYESIYGMMDFLQASGGLVTAAKDDPKLVVKISILTKGSSGQPMQDIVSEYRREVEARQQAQREKNAGVDKAARKRFGSKDAKGRRKSKYELIAEYEARLAELEKGKQ